MITDPIARGEAPSRNVLPLETLKARVGEEVGISSWREVSQERIDGFAAVTDDHQFIHVDPARADAETEFGGTIAHGFLTLSLLSTLAYEVLPVPQGRVLGINYGFDRVRFLNPVRAGQRVRGRFTLAEMSERGEGQMMMRYAVTVEIEGEAKPALAADWLTLTVLA